MSDPKENEAVAPEPAKPATPEHHQAKRGVEGCRRDRLQRAGGELMDGRIADITDGDKPLGLH